MAKRSGALVELCERVEAWRKQEGFWLCQKRLSTGRFRYWPGQDGSTQHALLAPELQVLLMAGDPDATRAAPQWRSVQPPELGNEPIA